MTQVQTPNKTVNEENQVPAFHDTVPVANASMHHGASASDFHDIYLAGQNTLPQNNRAHR